MMDFLQYADGTNSLQGISKFIMVDYNKAKKIYNILSKNDLIFKN